MKYFRWTIGLVLVLSLVLVGCSTNAEKPVESGDTQTEMAEASEPSAEAPESTPADSESDLPDSENDPAEELDTNDSTTESETETGLPEMTVEELAKYSGQDDQPTYVAVDGIVYDVSLLAKWAGGKHMGHEAGQDLSEAILKSPHGKAILERATPVATLVE